MSRLFRTFIMVDETVKKNISRKTRYIINNKVGKKIILFLLALLLSAGIFFLGPAYSSQIKSTQSLGIHFTEADDNLVSYLTNSVNTHNSFILQSAEGGLFTTFLEDQRTLNFSRELGDSDVAAASVRSYVVEYSEGAKIFRGITAIGPDVYIKDILLPETIDTQKAFPLINVRGSVNEGGQIQTQFFKATFPDRNTLRLQRQDLPPGLDSSFASTLYVAWQVIELQTDVIVKSGTVSIPYNASRATVDLSADSIRDINKAFLVFNYTGGAGIGGLGGLLMTRGTITDVNALAFNRAAIGNTKNQNIDIAWYVIEFTDSASNVQKGSVIIDTGSLSVNASLNPPVDTMRAFPIISTSGGDVTITTLSDDLVRAEIIKTAATGDTLSLTRRTSTVAAEVDWFVVELAPLTIKAPNEGEVWRVGEVQNILWSHASCLETGGSSPEGHHLLKILLSRDGGQQFPFTIARGVDATSDFYTWTVPPMLERVNLIGDRLRVRLIDTDLATHNYDDSNNNFKIKGTIGLEVPVGGEVWRTGDTNRDIIWHKKGDLSYSTFSIALSENGGLTYETVVADGLTQKSLCVGDRCSWTWAPGIPDKIGWDRRIKVFLASDPDKVYDTSDKDFYIKGKLQITSPNGGQEWESQSTQTISWNKWGSFDKASLYYSKDSGANFDYIIATGVPAGRASGSYDWYIPSETVTDFARIKIVSEQVSDIQVEDVSDADFRIIPSLLEVTSPNKGDEVWFVGDSQLITWKVYGAVGKVYCWYSKDGQDPVRITPEGGLEADQGERQGSFTWTDIPDDAVSEDVYIIVAKVNGDEAPGTSYDYSDKPFSIKGRLRVISPNGTEVYTVGSTETIRWDAQGLVGNVRIKFAQDGVDFNTAITPQPDGVPASRREFVWDSIPDVLTSKGKIRIELIFDPADVYDESDNYFSITGLLTLIAPNGGETFYVYDSTNIEWGVVGNVGNVELRYSTDGGDTYPDSQIIASEIPQGASPFAWKIPDEINNHVRVRLAAVGDEAMFDISDGDFIIKGGLYLTAPNGGEVWRVGAWEKITWERLGKDMGDVKLEYSTNNGADGYPNLIISDLPSSSLSYSWQIPEAVGGQLKIKITLLSDASTYDTSDDVFSIKKGFALLSPKGGQTWYVGAQENISWTTYGTIDRVNLYYSTDGGATYSQRIASAISNINGYLWTIPDAIGTQLRVKVEDYHNSSVYVASDENFTIKSKVIVTSPNGGEVWRAGETQNITWVPYGIAGNVEIRYSTDGGTTYGDNQVVTPVAGVAASLGTYTWTVPDAIGTDIKVKITSLKDISANGESNAVFEIKGIFTLTAPDGGQTFYVNDSTNITWTKTGTLGNIELRYSTDGGLTYPAGNVIATGIQATATPYSWTIPDAIGNQLRVRVSSLNDPENVYDESNTNFTVRGSLTLTSPNGNEVWIVGDTQNITWMRAGSIANVRLEYSADSGKTYTNLIVASTETSSGSYAWDIPDRIGSTLRVKITEVDNDDVSDVSDADFSIKGSLILTSPDGGEVWIVGGDRDITWSRTGDLANIRLEYSTNGFADETQTNLITSSCPAAALSYAWKVSDAIGTNLKIRIRDVADASVFDLSNYPFAIKGALDLTSPYGGEAWIVGQTRNITWKRTGDIANVKLEYSTDGGATFPNTITPSTDAAVGSYPWIIPDAIGNQLRVRIIDVSDSTVFDTSKDNFEVRGSLTLIAPNGREAWFVGSRQDITWTKIGTVSRVRLEYSSDGGSTYADTIAASVDASLLVYSWTVPDDPSVNCMVKISNEADSDVYDESDAVFSIIGAITVQSPDGGEDWTVGSSQNITWTKTGTIGNVNIYADYGAGYLPAPIATVNSELTTLYNWYPIPNRVSNNCKIKITDADNESVVYDESDASFNIIGSFMINAPDGSPLTSGDPYAIKWTPVGSAVHSVKIEFFDGADWSVIAPLATNTGRYDWTVPSTTSSTQCKIRLTASNPVQPATATESVPFWVHGKIQVSSPESTDKWTVGTREDIVFGVRGKVDNVNILYSKDAGVSYKYTIASNEPVAAGKNTYTWNIPIDQDILSASRGRVKVVDADYATVYSESDNFMLKGGIRLLTPADDGIILTYGGPPYDITWSTTGPIKDVRIYYSSDGGSSYPFEITPARGVPAKSASYSWDVPDKILGKLLKVRVEDEDNPDARDESIFNFEIIGQLSLTTPKGEEKWTVGSIQAITWQPTGRFRNVKIEASTDNFATTILNDTQSTVRGSYNWRIPDEISSAVKVRISDPDHHPELVTDTSSNFSILGGLDVTAPESGQVWKHGETDRNITWDATGTVTNVKIEYKTSIGGEYKTIIANDGGHTAGTNSYIWSTGVADESSQTCYVRVSDVNNYDDVYSVSKAPFSIRPNITVSNPEAGANIEVGTNKPYTVDWSVNGSTKVTTIDVAYSTNGPAGPFDKHIASGIDATLGSVAWSRVNDTITNNAMVRVVDTGNANVYGLSGAGTSPFNIVGAITVQSPDGGEDWIVGSSQNITWTKTGTIGNVNIYADYGAGYLPTPIATVNSELTTLYNWYPIPNRVSNNCKIKITDADNESVVYDESDATFHIAASFTVNTPGEGEVLVVDEGYDITWSREGSAVTQVKLEYADDGGKIWNLITDTAANSGIYLWAVPDAISTSCKVKISDPNNLAAHDESDGYFKIRGSLEVTSPNDWTESWDVGFAHPITWERRGSIPTINIFYSHNNGMDWMQLNTFVVDASLGTWDWTIEQGTQLTTQGLIKIVDASDSTAYDISDNNFEVKGSLILDTPSDSGITLAVGDPYDITWTNFGVSGNVQLYYSTTGGIAGAGVYPDPENLIAIVPAGDLSYTWSVPDAIGTNLRVRARAVDNYNVWDESESVFQIKGKVVLNQPRGGEVWRVGDTQQIRWTPIGTYDQVRLEYSTNAFANDLETFSMVTLAAGTNGVQQFYDWVVPDVIGSNLKVRVFDTNNPDVVDVSDKPFTIKGKLKLTSPDGGEAWIVDSIQNITWQRIGSIANIKLEYSTDAGTTFPNTIVSSTDASTGSYPWTIPDAIGSNLKVRVSDASDSTVWDVSNNSFTIKGALLLTAPNGTEAWVVSSVHNIIWERTGSIANVKLEYSLDGGIAYPNTIIPSTDASAGSFPWTIPDNPNATVKVRITDASDDSVLDTSDTNFKIIGSLTLTAPDGGQQWGIEESRKISWTILGSIANVKLEYSTNSGTSYDYLIIASTPGESLEYYWNIPDTPTTTARVKISDVSDIAVYDTSKADFKIQGRFIITQPAGGEVWSVGDVKDIIWGTVGSVANVRLQYSTDGGATYPNTIIDSVSNAGTYAWSIPDAISAKLRVRVSDVNDDEAFDVSNANFKIRGALDLTSPQGGQIWIVDSKHIITWSKTGSIATVRLEHSTDSGSTYPNTIARSVDASFGAYNWDIPDDISDQVKVRVSDASDVTVFDESDDVFSIKGTLTLITPDGGEQWVVGTAQNISWLPKGSIQNVKLEYSTNSGVTYPVLIVASTAAPIGSYGWDIPDEMGTNLRVRVSDASDSTVYDTSDADFTIRGALKVNAPNGGEIWYVGKRRNITWTKKGGIPLVKLEYSTNSGSSYDYLIIASTDASLQTYSWTVPDAIGENLRVRVTDTGDDTVYDTSDGDFAIKGLLELSSPNAGETWIVGSSQNITWIPSGAIQNVKLKYSTDGGNTYPHLIITSTNGIAGTYAWSIPDAIGWNLKVRVSDVSDPGVFDVSDNTFNIKGSLTITSPNGTEQWGVGTIQNITWRRTGSISNLSIEYSTDGGQSYPNTIIPSTNAATESYSWTIPDDLSATCKVKITNEADPTVYDTSDLNFKIVGILTLTAPNGAEAWGVGTTHSITWRRVGSIADVRLDYSTDRGGSYPNTITASTAASALSFTWTIPDAVSATGRVRISDASDISVYDTSDADFTIQVRFDVTSPDGGEVWTVNSSHDITWDTIGSVTTVRLDYSTDGGLTYPYNIAEYTANTGSLPWTIPDVISPRVRIKVSDYNNPDVFATSDANFKIRGGITVTAPDGGEAWIVGRSHDITWSIVGTIANVKLDYSTDGGSTYPYAIVSSVDATLGTYAWVIPDTLSRTARVKITDASDSTVYDVSNNNFKIRGDLTLTAPNGGQEWEVGRTENITWSPTGSIQNVKIGYSTNGGLTYPYTIIDSVDASIEIYPWTVDDAISNQVKVRISDASDSTVYDTSDTNFKIKGALAITSPNGGEFWGVGSSQGITWEATGSISNVELEYSTDGGKTYPYRIAPSVNASLETYSWVIPNNISSQVKIKITDLSDLGVYDTSDANFSIIGRLILTAPNGGEVWPVGVSQAVTWSPIGSFRNVKLEYSTNGGVTYPYLIVASTDAQAGSYNWTVPDAISQTARVKVSDADNPDIVRDTSDGNFKIRGNLTLTSPNGGEAWLINSSQDITWMRFGSVANVKLEYSIDSGATFPYLIIGSVDASLETYSWTVSDNLSTQARIKISDVADPTVYDISNANFIIRGGFALTAPNGTEAWAVDSIHNITWDSVGNITDVKLEYSTDGGSQWNIIVGSLSNTGAYPWTVPDAISYECVVKISDVNDPDANDISDGVFKIHGLLTLTAPNGGQEWGVGSAQEITWSKTGSIANLRLEYSTDGGRSYPNLIIGEVPASGLSYQWTIPDAVSNNIKVKISDSNDSEVFDASDRVFKIKGSFAITSPNGDEIWVVADSENITWNTNGAVNNVKLEYSVDAGDNWVLIAESIPNAGEYPWTVPDSISTQCRVRVSDVGDPSAQDASDNNFKIRGNLIIAAPNAGEKWGVGTNQIIAWEGIGSIVNVSLEYTDDGGAAFVPIINSTPNTGSYDWIIPDAITTQGLVRITNIDDLTVTDTSDAFFRIQGGLTITSPDGGEAWLVRSRHNITWTWNGTVPFVNLEYSSDSGFTYSLIEDNLVNNGKYSWPVPDSVGPNIRVRVSDATDPEAFDISNADFRIRCAFNLTSPNGDEHWRVGRPYDISWTRIGTIPEVRLQYSRDNFVTDIKTIALAAPNILVYSWTIPDAISDTVKVRISDPSDASAYDDSNADFRITADFVIITPNGREEWNVGSTQDITWTWAGAVPLVRIDYSTDGGATFSIIDAADNTGRYSWTVPNEITDAFKVRISDLADSTANDTSDANAKIIANF